MTATDSHDSKSAADPPTEGPRRRGRWGLRIALAAIGLLLAGGVVVLADWYVAVPASQTPHYVGTQACIECHRKEYDAWVGSFHDRAMDLATDQTVLGDFNNATLEHFGIASRMFRDGEKFMIHTEGPDGNLHDYHVKYVFGVHPLQQYMVEFDRPKNMPESEIARLQVSRICSDVDKKRWFYLSPPDAKEKLAPDDPLHWTRMGQNWNHMCADCHSTDLRKNFDLNELVYHTTFSDIDVGCEACHGPSSTHVDLAESKLLFWDRKQGYALPRFPEDDPQAEIRLCAKCHSRRRVVYPDFVPGKPYYDYYANELLTPSTYYCDGQILDEVYEYGSFVQSKMYHKGIRCTDCHDAHSTKVRSLDNQLCVSCHAHSAGQLDTPAHHHHKIDSKGALCYECHMPESPYMDIDPRRDHSIRIPRPDLSVELDTPNACTRCHLDIDRIDPEKRDKLTSYAQWMEAAREGDEQVRAEIDRIDLWARKICEEWYGPRKETEREKHFAYTLKAAWENDPKAIPDLIKLTENRRLPAIIRATGVEALGRFDDSRVEYALIRALEDPDPTVRAAAVVGLERFVDAELVGTHLLALLRDPVRLVRLETARVIAPLVTPGAPAAGETIHLNQEQQTLFDRSIEEFRTAMLSNGDQAGAHMTLGIFAEQLGRDVEATTHYKNAIRVQGDLTGARTNLAAIYDRLAQGSAQVQRLDRAREYAEQAEKLRAEEFNLIERDVHLMPDEPGLQYRYGLALYHQGRETEAEKALLKAHELDRNLPEPIFALVLFYKEKQRYKEALALAEELIRLVPENRMYRQVYEEIARQAGKMEPWKTQP